MYRYYFAMAYYARVGGVWHPTLQSLIVKTDFMLEKQDLPEDRLELGNCQ